MNEMLKLMKDKFKKELLTEMKDQSSLDHQLAQASKSYGEKRKIFS
jgi:hypothetical protein